MDRWIELFEATLLAKSVISLDELTREDATTNPREKELMGGVEEPNAEKNP